MRAVISVCLFFVLFSCKKSVSLSDCLQSKVDQFKTSVQRTNADIAEYNFQGKLVYVFSHGGCFADAGAEVYDSDCNYLGTIGGFIGGTKIDGQDFYANAKYRRTIWHN